MTTFSEFAQAILGLSTEPRDLTFQQVSVRGVVVFIATLIMVRLGSKRSLAEKTAFDAVLIVIIGSMKSILSLTILCGLLLTLTPGCNRSTLTGSKLVLANYDQVTNGMR